MIHSKKKLALALLAPLIIIAVALGIYFGIKNKELHYVGGVVTNGYECAEIGSSMFSKGGSAIDAAIAALFCEGVAMPQSMGIGGGFLMTIYIRETKSVITLNAREAAPLDAHKDMFKGNATLSSRGGLSIAVPGELRGYYEAHQKYGKLPWAELIEPTIALCKKGHLITDYLEKMFKRTEWLFRMDPNLGEIFIDPKTNQPYKKGQYVKREKLAATLEVIAKKGADALYDGELTQKFVDDIQEAGGIIKVQDMNIYRPVWEPPIVAKLPNNQTLYTSPLPGSGVVLTFILNILNNFLDLSKLHSLSNWQRIVESFKFGYARRTELGDPSFVSGIHEIIDNLTSQAYGDSVRKYISDDVTYNDPKYYGAIFATARDHGTAHVSVLAPNGDAVSATSTINQYFGAGVVSKSTGIILNDEMDDFSSPNITNGFGISPSPANFIFPKKRPLSSMCPSIIVDENGDVLLVIGAAGGSKITSSIALVTIRHLWFGESLNTAISAPRLHHQLFPMRIDFENDFDKGLIKELEAIGHKEFVAAPADGFSALTGLSKRNGIIQGSGDRRRTGQVFLIK